MNDALKSPMMIPFLLPKTSWWIMLVDNPLGKKYDGGM